jgi:hypothetical protein
VLEIVSLSCIVEGHGETQAVPVLIRRIAEELDPALIVNIPPPIRVSKMALLNKAGELEQRIALAARMGVGILILIDADNDCPRHLAPHLLERARKARGDRHIGVVLAKCEFEAWFLAAAASIGGKRGLPPNLPVISEPEGIQGAKEHLVELSGGNYSPVVDQPALAAVFVLRLSRKNAPSFDKCYREVARLINLLRGK